MNTKENAPVRGGTQTEARQATETKTAGEAVYFSNSHFTTNIAEVQGIFEILPIGERNAISSKALTEIIGAPSVRELQNRIAVEREQGKLILSTCRNGGGYFRPSPGEIGKGEIERYIATLRARALNTLRVLRSAKAAVATSELSGQIDLDDLGVM